ncbi:unnamed protein product [Protopolystoma xenopodis]|uniref:Inositol polyphosphate-related phosphatase domain-containing protein n=1 Tax=Protopolystoma xenopodis TaxID=117903 RepID=A0A3S5CBU2_9PLAT|nr:unnamed protein product [Protopolystoma xenopodis]
MTDDNRIYRDQKMLWQNNGDEISRIYASTGALGSGRSKLRDAQRSAVRTIKNNFLDSAKQEAMKKLLSQSSLEGWMGISAAQLLPRRLLYLPPALLMEILNRYPQFTRKESLRIFIGTWNLNGGKYFRSVTHKNESVTDWLLDLPDSVSHNWGYRNPSFDLAHLKERRIDLFAIGFEEIVDLNATNVVSVGGSKVSSSQRDWSRFLHLKLNRDSPIDDPYVLVSSVQLVGVCLFLFTRKKLASHLHGVASASVKTGLGGTAGNKGGVAICCQVNASSRFYYLNFLEN